MMAPFVRRRAAAIGNDRRESGHRADIVNRSTMTHNAEIATNVLCDGGDVKECPMCTSRR